MTIYEELIKRVSEGETFHIDFEKQTMKIGKQKIVDNGVYDEDRTLYTKSLLEMSDVLSFLEDYYESYKYSLPSERSDSKRKKYFKALPIEKISDEVLMMAERREVAQARLEGFVLCMVLEGQFIWDEEELGKWFYQSVRNPDLVILRSWIENKNNK
jgi:hypothetical protein